ncbi:MAG: hypothetical protein ACXVBZ_14250 [Flavisolibacter sp.]
MKLLVLFFPSTDELIGFRWAINPKVYQADLDQKTMLCLCDEEQAELANYVYGASILEVHHSDN